MFFILILFLFVSCSSVSCEFHEDSVVVATWNVQEFFDAVKDGCEYTDFQVSKNWGKDAYDVRLKRLAGAIKKIDADVFVMQELENEKVLQDISNYLAGDWDSSRIYQYGCFAKEEKSAIGCGILSRVKLGNVKIHSFDMRNQEQKQPVLRPVLEAEIYDKDHSIVLLCNHWKSRSGGAEESEIWRNRQEGIVADCLDRLIARKKEVVVLGDFNRDITDFECHGENVLFRFWSNGGLSENGIQLKSLWLSEPEENSGSYYYKNEWCRIDNIFVSKNLQTGEFYPCREGPWCENATGVPIKYSVWSGEGYSDHLPLVCRVYW